jgi:hypothetical protein
MTCLESLALDDCHRITSAGIEALAAPGAPALRELSLRRATRVGDAALAAVAARGALARLCVSGVGGAGPALAASLSSACRGTLEVLNLAFCRGVPEDGLGLVLDRCSKLQEVDVCGCSQLTARFFYGHSSGARVLGMGTLASALPA